MAILGALVWFSLHLALRRIYQVDECQNLYMAKVLAAGQESQFFTYPSLFLLGPLGWIANNGTAAEHQFATARLLFAALFWINLVLLARIICARLWSPQMLAALAAAATLAPVWDYGFEIRHDNVVLTCILLIWWAVRVKPMGLRSYALAGALTIAALFIAIKSVVYVLPLSAAILLFPPPHHQRSRRQLIPAWIAGALLAFVAIRICYGTGGRFETYLGVFQDVSRYSAGNSGGGRFWPWQTLARLLQQTPLLVALATAGLFAAGINLVRQRTAAFTWNGTFPEVLLLLGALAGLLANPNPFPYNLVHVAPYAFVLAAKYGGELWKELQTRTSLTAFAIAVLVLAHLLPFTAATLRHLGRTNSRQQELTRLAENLTDPARDRVYDATGLVLTRQSIHFQWYLHSLNIQRIVNTPGLRVRDMLAAKPAAVLISSYRTGWLPAEDHEFIRQRYVTLADDFRVLGTALPFGGGTFEIVHPGRYRVATMLEAGADSTDVGDSSLRLQDDGPFIGTLDGLTLSNRTVELSAGVHQLATTPDRRSAVVWIGPNLDRIPRAGEGDRRALFVNWY